MDDEIKDPNELEEGLDMADEKQQDENEEEGVETHSDYKPADRCDVPKLVPRLRLVRYFGTRRA